MLLNVPKSQHLHISGSLLFSLLIPNDNGIHIFISLFTSAKRLAIMIDSFLKLAIQVDVTATQAGRTLTFIERIFEWPTLNIFLPDFF